VQGRRRRRLPTSARSFSRYPAPRAMSGTHMQLWSPTRAVRTSADYSTSSRSVCCQHFHPNPICPGTCAATLRWTISSLFKQRWFPERTVRGWPRREWQTVSSSFVSRVSTPICVKSSVCRGAKRGPGVRGRDDHSDISGPLLAIGQSIPSSNIGDCAGVTFPLVTCGQVNLPA
jgi:hypothetical protein